MQLKNTLFGETWQFKDLKDVLNKAEEHRSGDVLAGVAAQNARQRVAAKQVLSQVLLADLRENPVVPYEKDAVTRVIQNTVHEPSYAAIRNWSVAEFRQFLLSCDDPVKLEVARKGLTSEMAAAVSKILSNADLVYAAKRLPVITRNNNTLVSSCKKFE
jgi:ethanolamine ammonia-lyase large subunit